METQDQIQPQIHVDQDFIDLTIDGYTAYLNFETYGGVLDVRKTFVPNELRGKGVAGKLVKAAYDYAREHHYGCVGTCSYAVKWLERHPEYEGRPSEDYVPDSCAIGKHQAK